MNGKVLVDDQGVGGDTTGNDSPDIGERCLRWSGSVLE